MLVVLRLLLPPDADACGGGGSGGTESNARALDVEATGEAKRSSGCAWRNGIDAEMRLLLPLLLLLLVVGEACREEGADLRPPPTAGE